MVNYQNGKIYKIVDHTTDNIYIGSTCEPTLAKRLSKHVTSYKCYTTTKLTNYLTSFDIIKNQNYEIILIENYPCQNRDELHAREAFWIQQIKCINRNLPYLGLTVKHTDKREYDKEYHKTQQNKIALRKHNKRLTTVIQKYDCMCGGKYTSENKYNHMHTKLHLSFVSLSGTKDAIEHCT